MYATFRCTLLSSLFLTVTIFPGPKRRRRDGHAVRLGRGSRTELLKRTTTTAHATRLTPCLPSEDTTDVATTTSRHRSCELVQFGDLSSRPLPTAKESTPQTTVIEHSISKRPPTPTPLHTLRKELSFRTIVEEEDELATPTYAARDEETGHARAGRGMLESEDEVKEESDKKKYGCPLPGCGVTKRKTLLRTRSRSGSFGISYVVVRDKITGEEYTVPADIYAVVSTSDLDDEGQIRMLKQAHIARDPKQLLQTPHTEEAIKDLGETIIRSQGDMLQLFVSEAMKRRKAEEARLALEQKELAEKEKRNRYVRCRTGSLVVGTIFSLLLSGYNFAASHFDEWGIDWFGSEPSNSTST